MKRKMVIVLLMCVCLFTGCSNQSRNIIKFQGYFENQEYDEAAKQYLKLSNNEKKYVNSEVIENEINRIYEQYMEEKVEYDVAISMLDRLKIFENKSELCTQKRDQIEKEEAMKTAYVDGKKAMDSDDYYTAIHYFVIIEKSHEDYDKAQSLLQECLKSVEPEINAEIVKVSEAKTYDEAITIYFEVANNEIIGYSEILEQSLKEANDYCANLAMVDINTDMSNMDIDAAKKVAISAMKACPENQELENLYNEIKDKKIVDFNQDNLGGVSANAFEGGWITQSTLSSGREVKEALYLETFSDEETKVSVGLNDGKYSNFVANISTTNTYKGAQNIDVSAVLDYKDGTSQTVSICENLTPADGEKEFKINLNNATKITFIAKTHEKNPNIGNNWRTRCAIVDGRLL